MNPGRRTRLAPRTAAAFPSESLFDRVARAVCAADCLPRKELFESWEVARRTRRRFRGGRVVDLACGHGLVAWLLLLLDDTSPTALGVDTRLPASAGPLGESLARAWPRVGGRVELRQTSLDDVPLGPGDLVVSAHACGALTDRVIARAVAAGARLAVLPCCHDEQTCDAGGLDGWMDVSLAIDATRVRKLAALGYTTVTQVIPASVTPKNRLLLAAPALAGALAEPPDARLHGAAS